MHFLNRSFKFDFPVFGSHFWFIRKLPSLGEPGSEALCYTAKVQFSNERPRALEHTHLFRAHTSILWHLS